MSMEVGTEVENNLPGSLAAELPGNAWSYLESMLVEGETVQAVTVQRRLFALAHRRNLVSATSGRFIAIKRGLIGGFTPTAFRWQDIKSANIAVGVFGSTLTVTFLNQPDQSSDGSVRMLTYSGLRRAGAQAVYRICQAQEQAWREKRRLRELEEARARSGGFQGNLGGTTTAAAIVEDPMERLQKAKAMLDQGLISDSEYETIKARVIGQV